MKCSYCGHDNPDNEVYCVCGRPLRLGSSSSAPGYTPDPSSPFASQTLADVKRTRSVPVMPIILLILVLLGVGGFFGLRWLQKSHVTKPDAWETIDKPLYTITVPSEMEKGEMLTVQGSSYDLLDFFTSRNAGFDVSVHRYYDPEKEMYGSLTAKDFAAAQTLRTVKINDQVVNYTAREGKNYIYGEYAVHRPNYVGKSDEVWMIESMFPCPECCYLVNVYCAQEDKDEFRESMLKWLDSFTVK